MLCSSRLVFVRSKQDSNIKYLVNSNAIHVFFVRTFVIRTPGSNPGKVKNMLRTWPASGPFLI